MNLFGPKNVNGKKVTQSMPVSQPITPANESETLNFVSEQSGVKPVELDDFFEFLDTKTVQKIMETPSESKARINQNIAQMEYETNGARAILNSLS